MRRVSSRPAKKAKNGACVSSSGCWQMSGYSACRTPARARSSARCRQRGPRSPITRSRRSRPISASCAPMQTEASCSPTFPGSSRAPPTARASVTGSCATCSARASCCTSSTSRRSIPTPIPVRDARSIVNELKRYDPALHDKPRWLVLNKTRPHSRRTSARRASRRSSKLTAGKGPCSRSQQSMATAAAKSSMRSRTGSMRTPPIRRRPAVSAAIDAKLEF